MQENDENLTVSAYMVEEMKGTLVRTECVLPLPATSVVLELPYKSGGYDSVEVKHAQKNLLDFANAEIKKPYSSCAYQKTDTALTVTSGCVYIDLFTITNEFLNKHITVSSTRTGDGSQRIVVYQNNESQSVGTNPTLHLARQHLGYHVAVEFHVGSNGTTFENIQVEISPNTTPTAYEAFHGQTYTAELPT